MKVKIVINPKPPITIKAIMVIQTKGFSTYPVKELKPPNKSNPALQKVHLRYNS